MARARNIRPSIFTDERICGDGPEHTYVFMGLLVFSSKWGRLIDDAAAIAAEISPSGQQVDVEASIAHLTANGVLSRYEESGIRYIQILDIRQYCEVSADAPEHASEARRRARKRNAMPIWADQQAIKAIYRTAKKMNLESAKKWHVDHVIPLAGKNVCGLHVHTNLEIISAAENVRKSNKCEVEE